MAYVLALDQGTTSSRAILFDESGAIAAVAQKEFQQYYPQAGWVEHDPTEILTSQMSCAVEALGKVGARPRDVAAIGITNQRETVIVWERATGKAIHPAIVWQDRRTAALCKELEESGAGEAVSAKTGLVLDPYFSATKVRWILDNVAGARARAERGELAFGTVDSWLIWHLTSGHKHVTDVTNASRTLLFNVVKGEWDAGDAQALRRSGEHAARSCVVERARGRGDDDARTRAAWRLRASPAISRLRCSGSCAGARARRRIPTEQDAFCCRISARSLCGRSTS